MVFAKTGKDLDFHRGERGVDLLFNGNVKDEPGRKNPTMRPISDKGRSMRRSSPAARSTAKEDRRPTRKARSWTWRTNPFPGCTEWAIAWPRHRDARIGREWARLAPSSGSRIARRIRSTRNPFEVDRARKQGGGRVSPPCSGAHRRESIISMRHDRRRK